MTQRTLAERVHWAAWHPHQKLWNWGLTERLRRLPAGSFLERAVVAIDSALLAGRAISRYRRGDISRARVLYLDCGLHKEGLEVRSVDEWLRPAVAVLDIIGYEASPEHVADARASLDGVVVELRQVALVGPDQPETVRLYRSGPGGKGDSLFAERGVEFDEVPAVRLSAELPAPGEYDAVILRMNIEGAEWYVIQDLIAAGMVGRVDGFYGMWDDLSKIDPIRDREFRRLLSDAGVKPFTFNDRDYRNRLRLWAVRTDLRSTIAAALRRG